MSLILRFWDCLRQGKKKEKEKVEEEEEQNEGNFIPGWKVISNCETLLDNTSDRIWME